MIGSGAGARVSAGDLVPLGDRMRALRVARCCFVILILAAWATLPDARGASLQLVAGGGAALLVATTALEALWRAVQARAAWVFGIVVMLDAVYLAWASYGVNGLSTPLVALPLVQIVIVALLASSRTGLKLALWDALLLLSAHYADGSGALRHDGAAHVHLSGGYRAIVAHGVLFLVVALATSTLAAINERELRRRRYDLEALAQLALGLEAVDEPAAVADVLARHVHDAFDYGRCLIVEPSDGQLRVLSAQGMDEAELPSGTLIEPRSAPLVTAAIEDNRRILAAPTAVAGDACVAACVPTGSAIVLPLHADRTLGVLIAEHGARRGSRVERRLITILERFCSHAALALANAALLVRIRDAAATDTLTGLANRGRLDEAIGRACAGARRDRSVLSLAMIDIDHFKRINDEHGHQIGDRVLQLAGQVLAQTVRATDFAARYGGEEFCVVMPGTDLRSAAEAGERFRAAIAARCTDVPVTISVGVASAPEHGSTPEELVAAADRALYEAKGSGRDRVVTAPPSAAAAAAANEA